MAEKKEKDAARAGLQGRRRGEGVRRNHKDTVFRMLFQDKGRLLELYNAVSGRHYGNPEELVIVTLENAIYMGIKNDLAFIVDLNLHMYEHQSTVNPNIPLRFLQYVVNEYGRLTAGQNLFSGKMVKVPAPHFVVFYNGEARQPEVQTLNLSAAFDVPEEEPMLELLVKVFNINAGFNEELKKNCRTLGEYMEYVDRVRSYVVGLPTAEAVERAVDECIEQGILRDFLLANKAEVMSMDIFEYDERATRKAIREFEREEGRKEGIKEGIREGREEGMRNLVETCRELQCPRKVVQEKLAEKYGLSGAEAEAQVRKYWGGQEP